MLLRSVLMPGSILGTVVRRTEDPELLTGRGTFIDNLKVDDLLHMVFVRSTMAHASLLSVDTAAARSMDGVVAVYLADDLRLADLAGFMPINELCARPPLAVGRVRFVGDIVAAVVATHRAAAEDAAEAVVIDYEALPAIVDPEAALMPDAVQLFGDVEGNLAASWRDTQDVDPLAGADVVVRARLENQRIAVMPMEGNAIAAIPSDVSGLTVYVGTQLPHMFATEAVGLVGLESERLRVVTPHVGGSFGGKAGVIPEHLITMAAAQVLDRPVKFVESRQENLSIMHGRGQVQYVEMGLTSKGRITGLRCRMIGDAGAYGGYGGGLALGPTRTMAQGPYAIPVISYSGAAAVTNTAPTGGFRGAGRPEATAMLERLLDIAADELEIDPVEIRRRNLLPPDVFPYSTVMGARYDNGEYARCLEAVVSAARYDDLRAEQARRRATGERVQLGIGICTYVEITGFGGSEYASVEVHADGTATVKVGTSGHGQGHPTAFAMLVSDRLGIPVERIKFLQSDTSVVPRGGGTGGSRSLQLGGSSLYRAAQNLFDRARAMAAEMLEANPDDIVLTDDGRLGVAGSPSIGLDWPSIVQAADAVGQPLVEELDLVQDGATFPFGAHVAVVEVDIETGLVRWLRHIAVDDCGRIVNPLIVRGQQHGGIAQGAAQVLWEQFVYDADGNPLTSTLAEYEMPSAAEMPSFETMNTETPTHMNPVGAKGIGESGTIGSMPAVHNAVVDAVSHLGVRHIDMPCTPERVWRAIEAAQRGDAPGAWIEPTFDFETLPRRSGSEEPDQATVI
jgi:carbon-monoxide dehydrogenase large subunit